MQFTLLMFLIYFLTESYGYENSTKSFVVTSIEKEAIEKVKSLIGKEWLYRDYMKTDKYLIRWVRDAKLNPGKASEKIIDFHKFRKENNLDSIFNEDWTEIERRFPYQIIDGLDIAGAPILTIYQGQWDPRREILAGKLERLYRYVHFILEKCDVYIRNSTSINGTVIINLSGFSLRTHACLACMPIYPYIINTMEKNYPQIVKHFYLINTPRYFKPIIDLVLPLLSPYTSKVYSVYGFDKSEWAPVILKKIPAHLLRPEYGGTRTS